jgi:carbon storage regulator
MLVLTRRADEGLHIGDEIVVTVLGVEGDRVKLGIQAPRHVLVLRHELVEAVRGQNLAAVRSAEALEDPQALAALKQLWPAPGNGHTKS